MYTSRDTQNSEPKLMKNSYEKISFIQIFLKKLYSPFLWIGFNCLKATEPLQEDSVLFSLNFPGVPGTHIVDFKKMKV